MSKDRGRTGVPLCGDCDIDYLSREGQMDHDM